MIAEQQAPAAGRWGRVGAGLAAPGASLETWREVLSRLEHLDYGSIWINEVIGRGEVLTQATLMLTASERLVVGTGIAKIWARQAPAMQAGADTLAAAFPGRFALGLGVSARFLVESAGLSYGKPLTEMATYLDRMDAATAPAGAPAVPFPRLLAALGPRMLGLARDHADGAYPHSMPVEHTARARGILGPDKLLVVGLGVLLNKDRAQARDAARRASLFRMPDSPYVANLRRLGFAESELGPDPTDRVVDAMFACGNEEVVAERIRAHLDAGADHIVVQPMGADLATLVDHLETVSGLLD